MAIDDDDDDGSFKKPGAIPFQWEIRPGVPKSNPDQQQQKQPLSPPTLPSPSSPFYPNRPLSSRSRSPSPTPSQHRQNKLIKLQPPPQLGPTYSNSPRAGSFRSTPLARSDRWRLEQRRQPECVSSPGCFPVSPSLLRRKDSFKIMQRSNKNNNSRRVLPEADDWSSDLETISRWSLSSRRSVTSPYGDSPLSSSFSSYQSSPRFFRPVVSDDPEWAGFGLF